MKADPRQCVVIDTNVWLSAALTRTGTAAVLCRLLIERNFQHGFSQSTFDELRTRLWLPKFDRYASIESRRRFLSNTRESARWHEVPASLNAQTWCRDPNDDKFIALALAARGADVAIHYGRAQEEAVATVAELTALGASAMAHEADLSSEEAIDGLFAAVDARFGRLDILVNSAAEFRYQRFDRITAQDWDQTQAVNLRAPFLCTQRAARLMRRAPREAPALVVNIADLSGVGVWPGYVQHGVSKAGLLLRCSKFGLSDSDQFLKLRLGGIERLAQCLAVLGGCVLQLRLHRSEFGALSKQFGVELGDRGLGLRLRNHLGCFGGEIYQGIDRRICHDGSIVANRSYQTGITNTPFTDCVPAAAVGPQNTAPVSYTHLTLPTSDLV